MRHAVDQSLPVNEEKEKPLMRLLCDLCMLCGEYLFPSDRPNFVLQRRLIQFLLAITWLVAPNRYFSRGEIGTRQRE